MMEDRPLAWLRRKALADGGGRAWTSVGGVEVFLGGEGLRNTRMGALSSGGGETCARKAGEIGGGELFN